MTQAQGQENEAPVAPPDVAPSSRVMARSLLGGVALVALVLGVVWTQRKPIAQGYLARSLAQSQVRARYDLVKVGVQTQRIENLVLGDPAHPDLTADWVEVDLGYAWLSPQVRAVRISGARLYGDARGGTLRLGELDKFRDPRSTAPFSLPDIVLDMADSRLRMDTDAGPVGMTISGNGNLRSGFRGVIGAVIRNGALAGCVVPAVSAYWNVTTSRDGPLLVGPVRADALRCATRDVLLVRPEAKIDVRLSQALDHWSGRVTGRSQAARLQGVTLAGTRIATHFTGDSRATQGDTELTALAAAYKPYGVQESVVKAKWAVGGGAIRADGDVTLHNLGGWSAGVTQFLQSLGSHTPVSPLAQQLGRAVVAAQRVNNAHVHFAVQQDKGRTSLALTNARFASASGAIIRQNDGAIRYVGRGKGWTLAGSITSAGGGFPEAALRLNPADNGALSGQLFLKEYSAPGASLALDPVRFVAGADGTTRISAALRLSGPLAGGEVRGLSLPLEAHIDRGGGIMLNRGCTSLRFDRLQAGSMAFGPTRTPLCPIDSAGLFALRGGRLSGGGRIANLQLAGTMGNSAMRLSAAQAHMSWADRRFALTKPALVIGKGGAPIRLTASTLDGQFAGAGIGGRVSGLEAQIATVPLLVREGAARWGYTNGALSLDGNIMVIDAATPDRFNPLQSNDFALRMANSDITAHGSFFVPRTGAQVGRVDIVHHLRSGAGKADILVDALRFDNKTQPEDVTRLALGVVANVRGTVNGKGQVRWSSDDVTSDGEFSTQDMNLAAAFGPVDGLSTTLRFTDLIGLVTAPSQVATLKSVNPGVEVKDGRVVFALLPNQQVAVESGHWPFSGGELLLLPSMMDFGADRPRNLTFRVLGLDAGAFINTMELENISATGTFDGLLPMVFDAQGGRIVGGILVARQQGAPPLVIDHIEGISIPCDRTRLGGNLAYVGQVSNENLGRFGRLAFDALKNLQYKCLTVLMDGAVDGEIVTQVAFNGVNRGELSAVPKAIAQQFIGLPFIFNIKISAPFRGLMNTAKSFVDPSFLIRSQLGHQFQPVRQNPLAVQPRESDTGVTGDHK